MATRRKTSAAAGKSKKGGMLRTLIMITVSIIVLAALALSITYFYIKNDRKAAPKINEIKVEEPVVIKTKPSEILANEVIQSGEATQEPVKNKSVNLKSYEGTWVSTINGSMLNLKEESYLIDFPSVEKKIPFKGHYVVRGNSITFIASNDDPICGADPGQYTLVIKDNDLILSKITDKCSKRAGVLEARWFKL
jgi:hypothetical protein